MSCYEFDYMFDRGILSLCSPQLDFVIHRYVGDCVMPSKQASSSNLPTIEVPFYTIR